MASKTAEAEKLLSYQNENDCQHASDVAALFAALPSKDWGEWGWKLESIVAKQWLEAAALEQAAPSRGFINERVSLSTIM